VGRTLTTLVTSLTGRLHTPFRLSQSWHSEPRLRSVAGRWARRCGISFRLASRLLGSLCGSGDDVVHRPERGDCHTPTGPCPCSWVISNQRIQPGELNTQASSLPFGESYGRSRTDDHATSLSRPQQLLGGDRELVILSGLGAALMAVSVMTFLSFLIAFLGFGAIVASWRGLARPIR